MFDDAEQRVAKLALEDGTVFTGQAFGAEGTTFGEVVFNTSMTGYQEILTDPSYCGQIVTMTYPEIGNYGVNEEDFESASPHLSGFIVRNPSPIASNFRSSGTLDQFLVKHNIIGISAIDTRKLVRCIRDQGAMRGVISSEELDDSTLVEMARNSESLVGTDLVQRVLPDQPMDWCEKLSGWWDMKGPVDRTARSGPDTHLVALDFGMKRNIARHLYNLGCRVTILPGTATAEEVMANKPNGIFLSNGPGDPEPLTYAIKTIRDLLGQAPIFGICLGHQLFAQACGASTFKLKFGHRGGNQPVLNEANGRIEITSQNHGFAVSDENLPPELIVTHRNLNDNTIAGLRHTQYPAFSVQYHPEASAGPHDSQYLFQEFMAMVDAQPV
ncbi:MAG: glutamine-hydrolyzing carbamoyl-phosphate synthase small subunit [Mariniblastus sp.]|nr:glutamine-hydrolyzing carbamoyl-phosphate synthase small subunit [Mariniblastus sp.]